MLEFVRTNYVISYLILSYAKLRPVYEQLYLHFRIVISRYLVDTNNHRIERRHFQNYFGFRIFPFQRYSVGVLRGAFKL